MPTTTQLKKDRALWPFVVIATLIIASSCGQPGISAPTFVHLDKVAHFLVFGLLATLICRIPTEESGRLTLRQGLLAIGLTILVGSADELLQSTNPQRYADWADLLTDAIGATVAVVSYQHWPFYRRALEMGD